MNDTTKIALWCALYVLMAIMMIHSLCSSALASNYQANFQRVSLVENRPSQVATWARTPTVIICEHAPITQKQILSAVNFWKKLGHRFYSTQYKHDPMNKCLMDAPTGYIVVHMVTAGIRLEEVALAQTRFYVDNLTNKIQYAKIYMRKDVRETVLEHELGHALGFLHYNKINHIMNEKWAQGGWDKEGLESQPR